MKYWSFCLHEKEGLSVFTEDEIFMTQAAKNGINSITVRNVINSLGTQGIQFHVVLEDGITVANVSQVLPDYMLWNWVPVLSERVRRFFEEQGCDEKDFLPCTISCNQNDTYFMHLPIKAYDVLDFAKTESSIKIDVGEEHPIPFGINHLELRASREKLPNCFRVYSPSGSQLLSELFVNNVFKKSWIEAGFSGADFKVV